LRSRLLPVSRRRLVARWLLVLAASVLGLHLTGRALLASAITQAPNCPLSVAPSPDAPPPELARLGVTETLRLHVGPPVAELSAWVLEPPGGKRARGTVLLLHGVRLDKRSMLPIAMALAEDGFRSVLVDLRGHGRSSGEYLTYGLLESRDMSQLLDVLQARGIELGPVGVHGFSYGAATAIHLAARDARVRAVVAVSAFSSVRAVVRDYLRCYLPELEPALPGRWLDAAIDLGGEMAAFDPDAAAPERAVAHSHAPILVLHGTGDQQVPAYHARILERAAGGRVTTRLFPGESHGAMLADEKKAVSRAARSWFDAELVPIGAKPKTRI
jgi:pimeloyl-ACP methyl ester carboxylesterase